MKCSKSFVHLSGLNNHLKLHREPHTVCLYCGRQFATKTECEHHENLHINRKVTCEICDKNFDTKNQLVEHNQIHIKRPYVCEICGLAFRRPFTLRSHMNRHAKAKHSGSFVLMVDMKDDQEIEQKPAPVNKTIDNNNIQDIMPKENVSVSTENESDFDNSYVNIGNGNYLKIQGNTIRIDGNDYILLDQNGESSNDNQQYQMVVDEAENQVPDVAPLNNTIMFIEDNQILLTQDQISQNQDDQNYILTTENVASKPNAAYIIGNQFVSDDQVSYSCE